MEDIEVESFMDQENKETKYWELQKLRKNSEKNQEKNQKTTRQVLRVAKTQMAVTEYVETGGAKGEKISQMWWIVLDNFGVIWCYMYCEWNLITLLPFAATCIIAL